MKVLLTGGGTGGHITPLLAVGHKLKELHPDVVLVYVGERDGKFDDLTDQVAIFDEQYRISAGKFRRYYGESWFKRLFDFKTIYLNIRDMFRFANGYFQAKRLLKRVKPDVILLKGGFVGVPVGLAAGRLKIPFVTHDSDALPGLANRIVSKWARVHATALSAEEYSYPQDRTIQVGVLVGEQYQPVTDAQKAVFRQGLDISADGLVLTVTGGSLGAQRINEAMVKAAPGLLETFPHLTIFHQVGKNRKGIPKDYRHERLHVMEFLHGLHRYTGAADVIVTRAGANTLAELGVQTKPCIVVPNPFLTGGHQTKNAQKLAAENAVIVVEENELAEKLGVAITDLLQNPEKRRQLGQTLASITITNAVDRLAQVLLDAASKQTDVERQHD